MELTERKLIQLFPSCLFTGRVSDLSMCDRVEVVLRAMHQASEGFRDETFYQTRDDIHTRPEMKELVDIALAESGRVLDFYEVKRTSHYITDMWGNITNPNHRHSMHTHPNCILSGLIYIKSPPDCGPTLFSDPRPGAHVIMPQVNKRTSYNSGQFLVAPEKGVMVLWPSFIPHAVERGRNRTNEDRIIVAFNVMIRGPIDINTAHLELK